MNDIFEKEMAHLMSLYKTPILIVNSETGEQRVVLIWINKDAENLYNTLSKMYAEYVFKDETEIEFKRSRLNQWKTNYKWISKILSFNLSP